MFWIEDYERGTEYGLKSLAELDAKITEQNLKEAEEWERESMHDAKLKKRIEDYEKGKSKSIENQ